jgi:diaminohydroxyphosphoribosylaminopyrimidine deaminase / 5-amino-6-(5-phosphoribosylamino)uracil reductase
VVLGLRGIPDDAAVLRHPQAPIVLKTHELAEALHELQQRGIRSLYVEAGPTLASAFVTAGLVDELAIYLAPTLIGGPRTALDDLGVGSIDEQRRLELRSVERLGDDLLITARPVTTTAGL